MTHLWFVKTTTPAQAPVILCSQLSDQNYYTFARTCSTLFLTDRYPWKLLEVTYSYKSSSKELHLHGRFKSQLTYVLTAISKELLYYLIQHVTKTSSLMNIDSSSTSRPVLQVYIYIKIVITLTKRIPLIFTKHFLVPRNQTCFKTYDQQNPRPFSDNTHLISNNGLFSDRNIRITVIILYRDGKLGRLPRLDPPT